MSEELTLQQKLDIIYKLEDKTDLSADDWNKISELINDNSSEIRLEISELLALFPSENSEKMLLSILNDSDYLIRASVCDSLYFSVSQETLHKLMTFAKDKRYLVRGYAILSIGDIQLNLKTDSGPIVEYLKMLEQKEKSQWVKIAIYRSLFILGDLSYGEKLVNMINNRYYKNRIFALNLIKQLFEDNQYNNMPNIITVIYKRLETERAYSVKLELNKLLEICLNKNNVKENTWDGSVC